MQFRYQHRKHQKTMFQPAKPSQWQVQVRRSTQCPHTIPSLLRPLHVRFVFKRTRLHDHLGVARNGLFVLAVLNQLVPCQCDESVVFFL